jgi:hypothetical protein
MRDVPSPTTRARKLLADAQLPAGYSRVSGVGCSGLGAYSTDMELVSQECNPIYNHVHLAYYIELEYTIQPH